MTLAPPRPQHAPSDPGGVEPTVTAVVVTRRDPRGLADLLEAVLTQSHPPDAVLVLDRTAGATLPDPADGIPARPVSPDDAPSAAAGDPAGTGTHAAAADGIPARPVSPDDAPSAAAGDPAGTGTLAAAADGIPAPRVADHGLPSSPADVAAVVEAARSSHADRGGGAVPIEVREVGHRTPVRATVHQALAEHAVDGAPTTLAWLLPVGTTPAGTALGVLLDTWRRSPSTGMVGPKHLDADDPHRLRALAIHSTRGGRLLPRPAPGEPDQGQYDRDGDALAIPFAGSLVERDLLLTARGWETSFGDVAADLDLGWRAHDLGRRVVVACGARMRTERGVAVATASSPARRRAARRVALARAPWWIAPLLALWIAATSVAAAIGLLLLKRPRSAWAELSSLASLDPFRGTTARWRTRHRREVGRRDLRALFEPRRAVLTGWGDAVHDALVSPRPPIGDAANDLNPRSWFVKVARHPGVLAVTGALAVTVLAGRTLGVGVVTGLGSGLTGGELVGNRAEAGTLWSAWTDGWTGAGLGGPDPVGPHAPLLAVPAWLVDHLPLLPSPASPAGFAVGLLVLFGMPFAAASAFVAFRTIIASRPVRGLAAFAWATTGVAAAGVAQGRLGALVALVLLPLVASGLWLVGTRRSTATSAFATALAGVVLGAFAPVLLAVVVALALLLALVRSRVRLHALVIAVVPVAVLAPWLVRGAEASWPVLAAGIGLAQWGGSTPEPWQLALLQTGGAGAPLAWTGIPLVAVAVLALFRGRAWGTATTSLALLAPVLLAAALVAPSVRLGTVPAGVEGAGDPITLWSGTLLLPFALVLVLSLARGVDGIRLSRAPGTGVVLLGTHWTSVTTTAAAVLVMAGGVAWAGLGTTLAPWSDPRPAVSVEQAGGAFATRALFVSPGDRGAGYRFVGREAAEVVRPLPVVADADGGVASRVSTVLGDASAGPQLFAETATDLLAVRSGIAPEVTRRLDATEGLQRVAPRDGWEMWRVSPTGTADEGLVAPPRLRLVTPDGSLLVETTGQHAATRTSIDAPRGSRLVVAEPLAWADHATVTVDGVVLAPAADASTPTYPLPVGPSDLRITVNDPVRWWHVGQLVAFACLAFLAVPFGRRASRVGRR